jgi:hypothetical protein
VNSFRKTPTKGADRSDEALPDRQMSLGVRIEHEPDLLEKEAIWEIGEGENIRQALNGNVRHFIKELSLGSVAVFLFNATPSGSMISSILNALRWNCDRLRPTLQLARSCGKNFCGTDLYVDLSDIKFGNDPLFASWIWGRHRSG